MALFPSKRSRSWWTSGSSRRVDLMMLRKRLLVFALAALASGTALASPAPADASPALLFFQNIGKLCGQRFNGATEFPLDDPGHPLAGKTLTISVEQCSDSEIRIPLQA